MIDWHRLFGLVLMDFFSGSCFEVELEKDLSQKKQLLDVLILRRKEGTFEGTLPDGLEDLADHNLLTYKSHHEALSDWSLKELTGHYVNYRKQVSPDFGRLLPEEQFRLYAVCARRPDKLAGRLPLTRRQPGVYDIERGTDTIRVIVLSEVPESEHNAPLHLFSAVPQIVRFGAAHFERHSSDVSTLINDLFSYYQIEGIDMPYTMEDYRRDSIKWRLEQLTPEERLELFPPEERLKGLPPEEILKWLPPEERWKGLSAEEILRSLPEEDLGELRRRLQE
jgi:hypothetical protein